MSELDNFLDAYGDDFAYSFDNSIMLNWYPARITARHAPSDRTLELGVGHGYTCAKLSDYFDHYEVIDGSAAVIERFKATFPTAKLKIHEGYFEDFKPAHAFDLIIMGFVLEHVADPALVLRRYREFLSPGGKLVVGVPNAESLHRRFGHAAGLLPDLSALSAADHALGHLRSFTATSLASLLEETGYEVTSREGIFLKPLMTDQLKALDLSEDILAGMCKVGQEYPELSAGLLFEAIAK